MLVAVAVADLSRQQTVPQVSEHDFYGQLDVSRNMQDFTGIVDMNHFVTLV